MKKLLLPIDSPEVPVKVLECLKEIVFAMDYEVTLLNVTAPERLVIHGGEYGAPAYYHDQLRESSKNVLDNFEKSLREAGITNIKKLSVDGEPDQMIVEIAENQGFHLVMMCTRGMGVAKRLLIGSVTNKVLHHSTIPVYIVQQ